MALTKDERMWLDEKFLNLHKRLDTVVSDVKDQQDFEKTINGLAAAYEEKLGTLRTEIEKRPTLVQILGACATAFGLGIAFGGLLLRGLS